MSKKVAKRIRWHYAWMQMIGCGLMVSGSIGFFTIIAGSFYVPVSVELGIDESKLTMYMSLIYLGQAVSMPLAGRWVPRMNIPVHMTLICAIEALAGAAMAFYNDVTMWYVSGAIIGFCMGFNTSVGIAIILNNWFAKRAGFAIGMAWAIASVCNAIMSPVVTQVIAGIGWRAGYLVLSLVGGLLMCASTLFILRLHPDLKGMKSYGYDEIQREAKENNDELEGVSFHDALRSPAFFCLLGAMCLIVITTVTNQLFPTYAASVSFDPAVGAAMVSAAMLCDIAWNPLIGITCDRFGPDKAVVLWSVVTIVSFGCLLFSSTSPVLACVGAGLNDTMYAVFGTGIAMLTMSVVGHKDYAKIYSLVPAVGYLVGFIGVPLLTFIFEATGGFNAVWIFCIVCDVLIAICALGAIHFAKKLSWTKADETEQLQGEVALADGVLS